jgi:hypothetical protein
MSKINIIFAFICGAFLSAILSYVIYNKKMIEPWEDYKRIERSIKEVSDFKKYSMPNIKLLHRGAWLKGEVEKIGNIKVVIDKDEVIDSLAEEKSNGAYDSEKFLRSYYSAYIDAIIAMNNQDLETGYIIYKKPNVRSDIGELTDNKDNKDNATDVTEEFTKEISKLKISRYQNSKWGHLKEIADDIYEYLKHYVKDGFKTEDDKAIESDEVIDNTGINESVDEEITEEDKESQIEGNK